MKRTRLALTILGSSCSIPRPGRACSAYLIEDDGRFVLLDFGTGAFSNLRQYIAPDALEAIVISHMHTDHFLDLIPLRYALRYGSRSRENRIPLHLPPGGIDMLERLGESLSRESGDFFHDVYEMQEYDPESVLQIGSSKLRFALTTHFIDAYAIRYTSGDASIVYSADTAYDEKVRELAGGANLFLSEATLGAHGIESGPVKGHICAAEAGQLAQLANVRSLVLTHYGTECNVTELELAARSTYRGEIIVADDHQRITIADGAPEKAIAQS